MYLLFALLIPILILLLIVGHHRKKKNIQRVESMCTDDKRILLNELLAPFGYYYILGQDIFTTRIDAWQREFGYGLLYDKAALHMNMVFDSLPVYFNYHERTWLFEFWKGQYGINTGCEMGLYHADRILETDELATTIFRSMGDNDMVKMSFTLYKNTEPMARLNRLHWWLTAFRVGCFSQPGELSMNVSVTFPNSEMARAFAAGLLDAGIPSEDICCHCSTISFIFDHTDAHPGLLRRLRLRLAQMSNRFWCKAYLFITRPFHTSLDRILYLYYYLPFAFRKTLRIRKYKGRKTIFHPNHSGRR